MAAADANGAVTNNTFIDTEVYLTNMLDELFEQESKTTMWTPNPALVQGFKNSKTGKIPSIFTSGLANYAGSYNIGQAKTEFVDYTLRYNRGVQHRVDQVDLMQAGNVPTASALLANFARMSVIPELDATRIEAVCKSVADVPGHTEGTTYTPDKKDILSKVRKGINTICDETGIDGGMTIHFNTKYKDLIQGSTEMTTVRNVTGDGNFDSTVPMIDGNRMVYTPSKRMWSDLVMSDGALDRLNNQVGFKPNTGAHEVLALITAPDTAQAIVAHEVVKIFGPEQVQDFDGSKINYHVYHDCIVPEHKKPGVYALLTSVTAPEARGPEAVQAAKAAEPTSKKK